jgi:hypothetical protein
MFFNPISRYAFTQTRLQFARFNDIYPWLYAAVIIVPLALVAIGIELNFAGGRSWNLSLSLIPGIALGFYLLRPQFYPWLLGIGVLDKLTDGVRNTPGQVLTGGLRQFRLLLTIWGHVSLLAQTALTLLAVWQFEDRAAAYTAVAALIGLATAIALFLGFTGRVYGRIMLAFWVVLFVGSLASAMFFPQYFKDQTSYWVRHAQGEQEAEKREARRNFLLGKIQAGEKLNLDERSELQFLNNQEAAVGQSIATTVADSFKLTDGLPNQDIHLAIKPGNYTCRAELTAMDPNDRTVMIGGTRVALETTAYINRQPCNGKAKIGFGPDGQAILHWNLDREAKLEVRGGTRWVRITLTPA